MNPFRGAVPQYLIVPINFGTSGGSYASQSTVLSFVSKTFAILVLGCLSFFGTQDSIQASPVELAPVSACHEHEQPPSLPNPDNHGCCVIGHSPALLTYASVNVDSPNVAISTSTDWTPVLVRGKAAGTFVATNRVEKPPSTSRLRV
jgi:hypothetical protein